MLIARVMNAPATLTETVLRQARDTRQEAAEGVVEVLSVAAAHAVERDRIDARVDETQTKADDAERVPELVVAVLRVRVEVEPHREHLAGEEADGEQHHERQHHFHHFPPTPSLVRLRANLQLIGELLVKKITF